MAQAYKQYTYKIHTIHQKRRIIFVFDGAGLFAVNDQKARGEGKRAGERDQVDGILGVKFPFKGGELILRFKEDRGAWVGLGQSEIQRLLIGAQETNNPALET